MTARSRILLCALLVLHQPVLLAQSFKYAATLDGVDSSGFYFITISPELSALARTDLSDIRITDGNNRWVPHFVQTRTSMRGMEHVGAEQDNPPASFTRSDNNGYTYLQLQQAKTYHVDKIIFALGGPKFYERQVRLTVPGNGRNHGSGEQEMLGGYKLVAGTPSVLELPRTRSSSFSIRITNGDNPPLTINRLSTSQRTMVLVTYLERGKQYGLLVGDSLVASPDYDLGLFKDSIRVIRPLPYHDLHAIAPTGISTGGNMAKSWTWLMISVAGILLALLAYRLTVDISRRDK
jgi:hypothetical protein